MENIKVGELKINNMNGVNTVNAPINELEIKGKAEDTSKDTFKSTESNEAMNGTEPIKKHVIVYIGSSEFIDVNGNKWHKNDEKTYDENEYNTRKDLHFMVQYGEMKHTVVTM